MRDSIDCKPIELINDKRIEKEWFIMNSSSSTSPVIDRKILSNAMAILEGLPIASIEFTVLREKGQETLLRVEILCLPKEKKNQIP